ncbi:MAG: laccase domain-containing protein [Minisyncoccia bacterium]
MKTKKVHLASENAEIFLFGRPKNWKDDFRNHQEIFPILKEKGITNIYLPDPTDFNGLLCKPADFKKEDKFNNINLFEECKAEGIVIPKNSGMFICTADCPTIVFHDIENDMLIAAHAGFGSVVDKTKITTDKPSRNHEGVVEEIMKKIKNTSMYEIHILCGISYNNFRYDINHFMHGETNKKIFDYLLKEYGDNAVPRGMEHGGISVPGIIKEQFICYGVDLDKITSDGIDTYADKDWWSHHRSINLEGKKCGRNGILILHK